MSRYRWMAGAMLLAVVVSAAAGTAIQRNRHREGVTLTPAGLAQGSDKTTKVTYALAGNTTSGQLAILDKKGKPVGVCPLKHTDVVADIAGYVARVQVTQTFHNPTNTPIEAVYTFPLPDDAAVNDMVMHVGNRTVVGRILKREEAREVYEDAKQAGQATALLDQERPNIFTQSVANILPGEQVSITIAYVNMLKYEEGRYEFVFPMVVGPRFTPGGGYREPGKRGDPSPDRPVPQRDDKSFVRDADKITPPITPEGTRAGHDISISVLLDAGLPLQEVKSALHNVAIERQGGSRARIRLANRNEIPNKDFILRYSAAGSQLQSGILTYAPGGATVIPASLNNRASAPQVDGYFTLIIQPPLAPAKGDITPKEMVFVIDQTGSQGGWPIAKAKETMRHCLQSLNPGDTFQLIGFNTDIFPCFKEPVPNTPANVQKALAFLEPLQGSGGTDILKSVAYALKLPDDPNRLRIVCYMTDGYVGNDMQIIDYIQKNRGRARMFPFGVGNSVNRFLIEGMAREGRGASEYVLLDAPGEGAAARFTKRVANPLLTNISIDWNGLPVEEVYPQHIPDVFSAAPIIVKGRYTRPGEGFITVQGMLRGKPWSQRLPVVLPARKPEGIALATLWARERIEDLQSKDWRGAQSGTPDPKITEQIVETALNYRLMSQYTSFVAVEEKVINIGGKNRTVDVPVEMPEGVSYKGIFGDEDAKEGRSSNLPSTLSVRYRAKAGAGRGGNGYRGMMGGSASGGGGFSGGSGARPGGAAGASNAPQAGLPAAKARNLSKAKDAEVADLSDIAQGTEAGQKWLSALKPAERRALFIQAKLAPALRGLAEKVRKEGQKGSLDKPGLPKVENGRVEIQIRLNSLPTSGIRQLVALGFTLEATLQPGKLLLGTVPVEKLDALVELGFVRRIELPKFR